MSTDVYLTGYDLSEITLPGVKNKYYELYAVEHLLGEAAPRSLVSDRERLADLRESLESLSPPPAVNEMNFGNLLGNIEGYGIHLFGGNGPIRIWLWGRSWLVLTGREMFPDFLKERTERGYQLWLKFIGDWEEYFKRTEEEWVPLSIGGTVYRVHPQRGVDGFLQGDELTTFADELYPHLGDLKGFYEGLDEDYADSVAVWGRSIELIYLLCLHIGAYGQQSGILAYYSY